MAIVAVIASSRSRSTVRYLSRTGRRVELVALNWFSSLRRLAKPRKRAKNPDGQLSIASGTIITGPGIGPLRLLQGGITFSLILLSLMQLLGHPNPLTVTVRWLDRVPCYTVTLQAPSHAEVVLGAMP